MRYMSVKDACFVFKYELSWERLSLTEYSKKPQRRICIKKIAQDIDIITLIIDIKVIGYWKSSNRNKYGVIKAE